MQCLHESMKVCSNLSSTFEMTSYYSILVVIRSSVYSILVTSILVMMWFSPVTGVSLTCVYMKVSWMCHRSNFQITLNYIQHSPVSACLASVTVRVGEDVVCSCGGDMQGYASDFIQFCQFICMWSAILKDKIFPMLDSVLISLCFLHLVQYEDI